MVFQKFLRTKCSFHESELIGKLCPCSCSKVYLKLLKYQGYQPRTSCYLIPKRRKVHESNKEPLILNFKPLNKCRNPNNAIKTNMLFSVPKGVNELIS